MWDTWYCLCMAQHLGKPVALPYVDVDDLLELAVELGAGYFPAADLYTWHCSQVGEKGRKPVSKKAFGSALREAKWQSSVRRIDNVNTRCWLITRGWERRAKEAEKVAAQ